LSPHALAGATATLFAFTPEAAAPARCCSGSGFSSAMQAGKTNARAKTNTRMRRA
jgi:hypothetical protein